MIPKHVRTHPFTYSLLWFTLLALIVRWHHLGDVPIWLDESLTGIIVNSADWLAMLKSENTPIIYYFIQRALCRLMLCDEFGLRFLSAVSGGAFVAITMVLVRNQTNLRTALLAGLLLVISPIHIYYSQEARAYSLLLLEIAGFYLMQWKIIHGEPKPQYLILFGCLTIVMLHTHYFSIFVVGSSILVYGTCQVLRIRETTRWYFVILFAALLTLLPWMGISVFGHRSSLSDLSWIQPIWEREQVVALIPNSIQLFLTGPTRPDNMLALKQYSHISMPDFFYQLKTVLMILLCALVLMLFFRWSRLRKSEKQTLIELGGQFAVPLVALLVLSYLVRPVYVIGRYDMVAFPAFILLLSYVLWLVALYRNPHPRVRVLVVGAFLVLTLSGQIITGSKYFSNWASEKEKSRGLETSKLMSHGSTIVFTGSNASVLLYYFLVDGYTKAGNYCINESEVIVNCFIFPKELDEAPASTERYKRLVREDSDSYEVDYILNRLTGDKFWLQVSSASLSNGSLALTKVSYKLVERFNSLGFFIERVDADLHLLRLAKP